MDHTQNRLIHRETVMPHFKPGDIFVVKDMGQPGGGLPSMSLAVQVVKTFFNVSSDRIPNTSSALQWLQSQTRHNNPQFVHAGIIINEDLLIEMTGQGITLGKISEELGGKTVVRFRCQDQDVVDLAVDLAVNLEKTLLYQQFPKLDKEQCLEVQVQEVPRIAYDFLGGVAALVTPRPRRNPITQLWNELVQVSDLANIPQKMFCSQLVVYVFALANLILDKPNTMFLPLNTVPCILHDYLIANPHFEHEVVMMSNPDLDSIATVQGFKEQLRATTSALGEDPESSELPPQPD